MHMKTSKNVVVLYDWNGDLTIKDLCGSIAFYLPAYYASLEHNGIIKYNKKQNSYKNLSKNDLPESGKLEIYGSLKSKKDLSNWGAYFFYEQSDINSTIILCGDFLTPDLVFSWLEKISEITRVGYGYMERCSLDSNPILDAFGVTFGYPQTHEEKEKATQDSRWFEERLYISGERKMRHLKGMFRSIYEVNIINDQHLLFKVDGFSLQHHLDIDPSYGRLIHLSKGSYMWIVSNEYLSRIRSAFELAGGLI